MKKLFLFTALLAFLFACTTAPEPEPVTVAGLFTNNMWGPSYTFNGKVKSYEMKAYLVAEEDGKYIQGEAISDSMRKALGWADDVAVHFDENGMVLKTKFMGEGGKVKAYLKTMIGEDGNYEVAEYFVEDSLNSTWDLMYEEINGRMFLAKMDQIRGDTLYNSYKFARDENGNRIGGQWFNYMEEKGWQHDWKLDEMDRVIKTVATGPEGQKAWYEYSYDENGFIVAWNGMMSDSTTIDIVQKYPEVDEKGNWTMMITYQDGELVGMDIQTIEYYKE